MSEFKNRGGNQISDLGAQRCAGVYLLDNPYFIDSEYTYFIPDELVGRVKRGSFVTVPFGNSNRRRMALVWRVGESDQGMML